MSEHEYNQTVCREYSQGVCHDGAAILKDGEPMTIEQILEELKAGQAARAQGGEAVAYTGHGNLDLLSKGCATSVFPECDKEKLLHPVPLYTHPQPAQQGSLPEGFVLAPKSMCITQEDVGLIAMMTGWDDEDQSDAEGVLWFGLIEDDDGKRTHGLNISCSECMEEGAIQLVQFDEPSATPQPEGDGWIKCTERLPTEADADGFGNVWACYVGDDEAECEPVRHARHYELWMPTGLKRPNPPSEGAE